MPNNIKIVATLEEITNGQLLSLKDLYGHDWVTIEKIPTTKFTLNMPVICSYFQVGEEYKNYSQPEYVIEQELIALRNVKMPVIRGAIAIDMAIKWYGAQIYDDKAHQYDYGPNKNDPLNYQSEVILYKQAHDIYIKLIDELMPYFEPSARAAARWKIASVTSDHSAYLAAEAFQYGLERQVYLHLRSANTTPQGLIDIWSYLMSVALALEIEADTNTNSLSHNDIMKKSFGYRSRKIKELFKTFMDKRDENSKTLQVQDDVAIKHHIAKVPKLMLNAYFATCGSTMPIDENVALLKKSKDASHAYVPPKNFSANTIDYDIIRIENALNDRVLSFMSRNMSGTTLFNELLKTVQDGINLLSMVHMRYRNLLVYNNNYWFSLSKPTSEINAAQYFTLVELYLKNIISPSVTNAVAVINASKYKQSLIDINSDDSDLKKLSRLVKNIDHYIHVKGNYDKTLTLDCENILSALNAEIEESDLTSDHLNYPDDNNGLRRRANVAPALT